MRIWPWSLVAAGLLLALAPGMEPLTTRVAAAGAEPMPLAEQNALVQRHCAVCHSDAARNGGLSLQHFDAAQVAPSVAAMMISKLTSGVPLATVQAAASDERAAALVAERLTSGAMLAAGVPPPSPATVLSLTTALASRARRAGEWHVDAALDPVTRGPVSSASILRELSSARAGAVAASYRLELTCESTTGAGEVRLTWAPSPKAGTLRVAIDGRAPIELRVDGTETMGNGSSGVTGPAALRVYRSTQAAQALLPRYSLTFSGLFEGETVDFGFIDLPPAARSGLAPCFTGA